MCAFILSVYKVVMFVSKYLQVDFVGEAGEDGGGLRREFWCLVGRDIKNSPFEGSGDRLIPRLDGTALQV